MDLLNNENISLNKKKKICNSCKKDKEKHGFNRINWELNEESDRICISCFKMSKKNIEQSKSKQDTNQDKDINIINEKLTNINKD